MEIVKIEGQRRNLYFGVTVESLYLFKTRTMTFNIYSIFNFWVRDIFYSLIGRLLDRNDSSRM